MEFSNTDNTRYTSQRPQGNFISPSPWVVYIGSYTSCHVIFGFDDIYSMKVAYLTFKTIFYKALNLFLSQTYLNWFFEQTSSKQ